MMAGFATTSSSGTPNSIWSYWVSPDATTSSASNDIVWMAWSSSGTSTSANVSINYRPYVAPQESAEAQQAREARRAEETRQREEARRKQIAEEQKAKRRAERLLLSLLDAQQRRDLRKSGSFEVFSELQKRYRIRRGRSMNVDELDDSGNKVATLCAHPQDRVPDADTMVAQLLMLKHNEQAFLSVANRRVAK